MADVHSLGHPKIFISYAWTSQEYIKRVLELAEHLMADGIETIIDQWDLAKGQDKYAFMEKMVSDDSINHVLLMLNKVYKEKADSHKGGAGTEAQIISSELYDKTDQTKFIPVVMERDEDGKEYAPIFIKNRIYIDLSNEEKCEEFYEELIRAIYHRPQYKKPKLGTAPSYLFDEKENDSDLGSCEKRLLFSVEKNDKKALLNARDFLAVFNSKLVNCHIQHDGSSSRSELGKLTYEKFIEMTPYRDSFLRIANHIAMYDNFQLNEVLYDFFSDVEKYYKPINNTRNSWYEEEFDNYRFFIYELILSVVAIQIKTRNYKFLKYSLGHTFINENNLSIPIEDRMETIMDKIEYPRSISDHYKTISGSPYYSPLAEILKHRVYNGISFSDIVEAEFSWFFYQMRKGMRNITSPLTMGYFWESRFSFLSGLAYKDKLNTILHIFNAKTKEELIEAINESHETFKNRFAWNRFGIPNITDIVKCEAWGTLE
jgi:hypothetical protein